MAQTAEVGIKRNSMLSTEVKYVDVDQNDTINLREAILVFNQYLLTDARDTPSDLVSDVESVVIDLISYLESINCSALKKTVGAKRFIELYYVDKFKDMKQIQSLP